MKTRVVENCGGWIVFGILTLYLAACGAGSSGERPADACGNGHIDLGEQCDHLDLAGKKCTDFQLDPTGVLACNANCTFNTDGCKQEKCGNGKVENLPEEIPNFGFFCEQCDGTDFGESSCAALGGSGSSTCNMSNAPGPFPPPFFPVPTGCLID